jgi:ABC-type Zn uptake system ZnuABC Zn-binding protein ZnuA
LTLVDPEHQNLYQANAAVLMQEIAVWRNETRQRWQNQQPRFITDHDFTGYFEQDFGLKAIATGHDQHNDHGGLKDLNRLDNLLRQSPAACLLTSQSTASPLARSLAQKHGIKIISIALEPISNPAQALILQRLTRLTTALQRCI